MFRKVSSIIVSAFILCGFTACSLTERELVETEYITEVPPRMLFLGDSIPAGYGLDGYTDSDNYNCESYSNILKVKYETELSEICNHEMQNFAVSGATSDDLLNLLDSGKLDSALESSNAVVVSIGGNDMLHIMFSMLSDLGMSSENRTIDIENIDIFGAAVQLMNMDSEIDDALMNFEVNLKEISTILGNKTNGTVYMQTLYNPLETFTDLQLIVDFSEEKINKYNQIIRNNAQNYTIIDIASEFEGKCGELTRIKTLDIHPNEDGHRFIAEIVDKSFRDAGFKYIKQEYSAPHLTLLAVFLILGGICAIVAVLLIIPKLFKKKDDEV